MKVTDIRIRIGRQTENIERLKAYADKTDFLWQCHQEECQMENLRT